MSRVITKLFVAVFISVLAGCVVESNESDCDSGYRMTQERRFREAVTVLSTCLVAPTTTPDMKRVAYITRGWAYFNLRDAASAVADQEAAFRIFESDSYGELINYAVYLRLAGRVADSLSPLRRAEAIDKSEGEVSMMTQYQLGWTLQELKQHAEAVEAFSRGIPDQKDYPFVYLRRGVSFDALGRETEARADFLEGMRLAKQRKDDLSAKELAPIRLKLSEYGIN